MRPPKLIKPYVLSFCRGIVTDPKPVYVPLRPLAGVPANSCFETVPPHVAKHGGEQVTGWSIWEWPLVFIEAEFHCVWRQPDGTLLDITPKSISMPRILFLPDPTKSYKGRQVDNIRKPMGNDPAIKRFCELSTLIYRELNKGELADYHGPIVLSPILQQYMTEKDNVQFRLMNRYGVTLPEQFDV